MTAPQLTWRYFSEVLIEVNTVLRLVPRPFTTAMIASEMPAAIKPYSMAVAPASSARNFARICFKFASNYVAQIYKRIMVSKGLRLGKIELPNSCKMTLIASIRVRRHRRRNHRAPRHRLPAKKKSSPTSTGNDRGFFATQAPTKQLDKANAGIHR